MVMAHGLRGRKWLACRTVPGQENIAFECHTPAQRLLSGASVFANRLQRVGPDALAHLSKPELRPRTPEKQYIAVGILELEST